QLRKQLQRFQQMVNKMREHSNAALDRVEQRKLPAGAPRDANDVSAARNIPRAGSPPLPADASAAAMYERLRQYEQEIQKWNVAVNAAKRTLTEGLSFPEVYASLTMSTSSMPSFDHLAAQDRKSTRLNSSHVKISYAV